MKKKISLVLAISLVVSMFSNFVMAANLNISNETAIILSGDMSAGGISIINGSVYSAEGNISLYDNKEGMQGVVVNGDVVYNEDNNLTVTNRKDVTGEINAVSETSFDYAVSDVDIDTGDISIFEGRDYDVREYVTAASWISGGLTIDKDTYFKGSLTLFEPLTVDTSNGDVYVMIDSLNMQNSADAKNNGVINVVGDGKLYLMVNASEWGGNVRLFLNADITYSGNRRNVTAGDSDKVDLYINANGKAAATASQSVVCANVYMVNEKADNEWNAVNIEGEIYGNIYTDGNYVRISADGSTAVVGDVYALSAEKVTICNDVTGDIVTNADAVDITGGDAQINGVLFAPEADVKICSTNGNDHKAEVNGQIVAKSLDISNDGKVVILYNEKAVEDFGVTVVDKPEATTEPTTEPTEEPEMTEEPVQEPEETAEPEVTTEPTEEPEVTEEPEQEPDEEDEYALDLIPSNDIPEGARKNLKSESAYIYGYTDQWIGADEEVKREEVCVMFNRLLVQNDAREDFEKPESASFADVSKDRWSYSALEYMTYIGVYNADDGTGELRRISPTTLVTRGEVAKIAAFTLRLPYEEGDIGFEDVTPEHKYYKYLKAMVDAGLWEGDGDMLRPDSYITRAEIVTTINRIIGRTEENGYIVTAEDCPFIYNKDSDDLFLPEGTLDEDGNDIGHWAYYEITRAACAFSKKKVDSDKRAERDWVDEQ